MPQPVTRLALRKVSFLLALAGTGGMASVAACSLTESFTGIAGPPVDAAFADDRGAADGGHLADAGGDAAEAAAEAAACAPDASFTADNDNCGSCGHGCQGGDCEGGVCQPFLLVAQAGGTSDGIARYQDYVYWTTYTTVGRALSDGGEANASFITGFHEANRLAVDDTGIYITDSTDPATSTFTSGIYLAPLDGGVASPLLLVGTDDGPQGIAFTDAGILWSSVDSGSVFTVQRDGGGLQQVLGPETNAYDVAANATDFFFPDNGNTNIKRAPLAQPDAAVAIVTGEPNPFGIALDDTTVYWADFGPSEPGQIRAALLDGGSVRTIAADQVNPTGVAVDEVAIYWIRRDGTIWKVAK